MIKENESDVGKHLILINRFKWGDKFLFPIVFEFQRMVHIAIKCLIEMVSDQNVAF